MEELRRILPDTEFFGCTGPRLRAAGVRTVVDAASLAVVGLVEVVAHIPRIYGEYRKLLAAASRPQARSRHPHRFPGFPPARGPQLHQQGIPVVYLVAPQAWAWRKGRVREMRRTIHRLLCIFPFEEEFFTRHGVPTTYIGHPLAGLVRPPSAAMSFLGNTGWPPNRPLITVLPGSRRGEAARHLPALLDAVQRIYLRAGRECGVAGLGDYRSRFFYRAHGALADPSD